MTKHSKKRASILMMLLGLLPVILGLGLSGELKAQEQFLTHHLDNLRTGWNQNETRLTPEALRQNRFHKVWETLPPATAIRGQVYGAPLFYSADCKGDGVKENFILIADEMNFVYALDAEDGSVRYEHQLGELEGKPERFLSQAEFDYKLRGSCIDLNKPTSGGPHGVTGTGVIDPETGTWYLSNLTIEEGVQVYKVHAINICEGTEVPGWPVTLEGSYRGRSFDAYRLTQRGPLTLLETDKGKKVVYVTFSSRCDAYEWNGWVIGINVGSKPAITYLFNSTPDGNGGGIWGPGGISIDTDGKHGYIVTGNGTVNWASGGLSYSHSLLKLDLTNPDQPFDYGNPDNFFTPTEYLVAEARDADFGGSSALVIPDQDPGKTTTPRLIFTASKTGRVFLLNRDKLGARDNTGSPMQGGELQQLRVGGGSRVAPTYFKDAMDRQFVYVTSCDEGTYPNSGTFLDWQDPFVAVMGDSGLPERAALGSGPSMIEFSPPESEETRMFLAWVRFDQDNPEDRTVLIKSSTDGRNWFPPVEVGGQTAPRTSPALAEFGGKLYISWINEAHRIVIQSSDDGESWSEADVRDEVATNTYASMAAFKDRLYVAYISSEGFNILLRAFNGKAWSDPISINARQANPISAPFIIPFIDKDNNQVLYAFWLRHRDDRTILFKTSSNGKTWSDERSFNESTNRESGLSGMVVRTVIEGQPDKGQNYRLGDPRLFILFLTNTGNVGQNDEILAKSIDKFGNLEGGPAGFYFRVHEACCPSFARAFSATKVGATSFRGQPVFTYVRGDGGWRDLRLKMGFLGYRGGGLSAFQLYVDPDTQETRFFPVWTAGRRPGSDPAIPPTSYDYLPGSPFVTSEPDGSNGVVWVFEGGIQPGHNPAILHAYDPATGVELFNSSRSSEFDQITLGGRKFAESVAINGCIYLGANTYMLDRNGVMAFCATGSK